jgi:hypothetical protein
MDSLSEKWNHPLLGNMPAPPEPRSDEELHTAMALFAEQLAGRWDGCSDYLARVPR